jgi:rare lipoprotein A
VAYGPTTCWVVPRIPAVHRNGGGWATIPRFLLCAGWIGLAALAAGCATTAPRLTTPQHEAEIGVASYYARKFEGRRTASGARYDPDAFTAAHRSLPFGTRVRVTHLESGRSVLVTINDRGPFRRGRVIDLSRRAARELGMLGEGIGRVRVEIVGS